MHFSCSRCWLFVCCAAVLSFDFGGESKSSPTPTKAQTKMQWTNPEIKSSSPTKQIAIILNQTSLFEDKIVKLFANLGSTKESFLRELELQEKATFPNSSLRFDNGMLLEQERNGRRILGTCDAWEVTPFQPPVSLQSGMVIPPNIARTKCIVFATFSDGTNTYVRRCSASLIGPSTVVLAHHCLDDTCSSAKWTKGSVSCGFGDFTPSLNVKFGPYALFDWLGTAFITTCEYQSNYEDSKRCYDGVPLADSTYDLE
jgi:hypothetical protein